MTDAEGARQRVPRAFHWLLAGAAGTIVSLNVISGDAYVAAMQEDGVVEWASFLLFLAAGVAGTVRSIGSRRAFDLLVAVFCLFVAGEEISWGQRLFGFMPPDLFLERNFQQETNLHNFSEIFGRPKWVLATLLALYGVALPAASAAVFRRAADRLGATPPPLSLLPWFAACVALLIWYPLEYTGEWVEMLAGALFVAALAGPHVLPAAVAALPVAIGLAWMSATRGPSSAEQLACAERETAALARDVAVRAGYADELTSYGSIEKRIWSAANAGYLAWDRLDEFEAVSCQGEDPARAAARRRYGIDPWGKAYWLETEGSGANAIVAIYSFGPNRRRDLSGGDDIRAIQPWPARRGR